MYLVAASWSAGYFVALEIAVPSVVSFSSVWLLAGIFFFWCFLRTGRKNGDDTYTPLQYFHPALRIVCACFSAAVILAALVTAFRIALPSVSSGGESARYVILLGGGVSARGTLSQATFLRVRKTADYMKAHPSVKAVVTGGKSFFAPCAESVVLASELERLGIAPERIIQEDRAADTIQNFSYSAALISRDAGVNVKTALSLPVAVVTSDYHLARAKRLARMLGYTSVYGIPAETPPLFTVTSWVREIGAYWKLDMRVIFTRSPSKLYGAL